MHGLLDLFLSYELLQMFGEFSCIFDDVGKGIVNALCLISAHGRLYACKGLFNLLGLLGVDSAQNRTAKDEYMIAESNFVF